MLQRGGAGLVGGSAGGVAIAAGLEHALVVLANHVVYAWGSNANGQIAAGATHSLAIDSAGGVWARSGNAAGQLGVGSTTVAKTPTKVGGLSLH